jgi:nucleotide-binding universal stress UspA family protein
MDKLLVPIDGSAVAERAVVHAIALARGLGRTSVLLLNVQQTLERWYKHGLLNPDALEHLHQLGEADAKQARALLEASGLPYELEVLFGHPGELIARTARERGCTGIVMGTRGLGDLANVFVGSTAYKVIQLADVPVTLVK